MGQNKQPQIAQTVCADTSSTACLLVYLELLLNDLCFNSLALLLIRH